MPQPLREAYADPDGEVAQALALGHKPIRTLGLDAPRARLTAAGFRPIRLVAPRLRDTPRADAIMGSAEISPRGRRLLEALIAPALPQVPVLITQADSEQPQIFAALRELGRLGEPVPRHVHFLDRLHIPRAASARYTQARLEQLDEWLISLGGQRPGGEALSAAEAALAEQRALLARVQQARAEGRISGSTALQAFGAVCILGSAEANAALEGLLAAPDAPEPGAPRIFVCGTAHEGDELYCALEQAGAAVIGENHGWGQRHALGHVESPRTANAADLARWSAEQIAALKPDLVLHLTLDGDEAAPWDIAALKRALPAGQRFNALRCGSLPGADFAAKALAAPQPAPAPLRPATNSVVRPPRAPAEGRSRKSLTSVASFNAYQRDWFAQVRQQVAAGAPFAMVNANAPQEILRALDIPFVVNQWWASIVAAKQQSRRYQALLRARDYPGDVEAYSAQGLAAAFDNDADQAPWGGLPRPDFVHAVASSDPTAKLFEQWALETGADCFIYERTVDPRADLYADWWVQLPGHWDSAVEAERIDLMVAEMREVIARMEARTGRTFDPAKFAEVMNLVNEQEDFYRKTRELVARTVPAPIGVVDSMPATMVPQWHRGTTWGRDAAKAFYDEVKARVDQGLAACPNEQVRLMWVGRGLWSEMGFYQQWEESHGAIFIWSMYLALAADGYIRDLSAGRDPLRALASRVVCMGDELRMPTWAGPWHVHEAETHAIDGAVALRDADPFVIRALRAAGVPVIEIDADNFNREGENARAIVETITQFIEGPASSQALKRKEAANVCA